jgi:hypothetical protein
MSLMTRKHGTYYGGSKILGPTNFGWWAKETDEPSGTEFDNNANMLTDNPLTPERKKNPSNFVVVKGKASALRPPSPQLLLTKRILALKERIRKIEKSELKKSLNSKMEFRKELERRRAIKDEGDI